LNVLGLFGALLSRKDWVYLLSLLIPFVVYDLALKASDIASLPGGFGLAQMVDLMGSNAFFDLGYALLWVGIFIAVRGRRLLRGAVVVLFQVTMVLVAVVNTFAHQYYQETGTTLDYDIIAVVVPNLGEVLPILTGGVPLSAWAILFAALLYTVLGPWLATRAARRWWGGCGVSPRPRMPMISFLGSIGVGLVAFALFGSLSLLVGASPAAISKSFAKDPFVNLMVTGAEEATVEEYPVPAVEHSAAHVSLTQTPQTQKHNVVLIHLESTRAGATTPYNENLETTPFLNELAKESLFAERAYTTVPHTSKATTSVTCGIFPHLVTSMSEALPGGIPAPCLAGLLKEQGYKTVFFQSSTKRFENFQGLVNNFGYEEYYPLESMDTEGFKKTNYFGLEDDVMLKPSEKWLKEHEDEPFVAEYLLGTGHHDYQCLGTRYGQEDFLTDDVANSYLNCMRLQDIFLKNLIDQYKELGLYDNTIFVIYGDHGEGFGEHGRLGHNDTIYEEGLKVPLIIHAPGLVEGGQRVKGLTNHTDILPTVLDLLGYEVKDGEYPGYSLLRPLPEDRTLYFSCWFEDQCLASIMGSDKYIYHYGNQPDELFDLSKDPLEQENLAERRPKEEVDQWREDLLRWRSSVDATYGGHPA
jgi:arylsulfatase A-like enzyme